MARRVITEEHGDHGGELMMQKLREFGVDKPNMAKFSSWESGSVPEWCLVIQTPLMSRVNSEIAEAKDCLFIDSTASVDLINTSLTIMATSSSVGVLPVCIAIHSNQREACYTSVFRIAQQQFNVSAKAFITDDCDAERNAIKNVWPDGELVLCIFHILQAIWRYIIDSKHHIPKADWKFLINRKFSIDCSAIIIHKFSLFFICSRNGVRIDPRRF